MGHRTSIYFDEAIHQALLMKAAVSGASVSDLVSGAVKVSLAEDAEDFAAFNARASEPALSFESVVAELQLRDKL